MTTSATKNVAVRKLNRRVQDAIVNAIVEGAKITDAIKHGNIGVRTYYDWMRRGEHAPDTSPYRVFRNAILRAQEAQFDAHLANIHKAGIEGVQETVVERVLDAHGNVVSEKQTTRMTHADWRASKAYLELSAPDRFRRRAIEHDVNVTDDDTPRVNVHLHFDDGESNGNENDDAKVIDVEPDDDGGASSN